MSLLSRHDPHQVDFFARARVGIDHVRAGSAAEPGQLGLAHEDAGALRAVRLLDPDPLAFVESVGHVPSNAVLQSAVICENCSRTFAAWAFTSSPSNSVPNAEMYAFAQPAAIDAFDW